MTVASMLAQPESGTDPARAPGADAGAAAAVSATLSEVILRDVLPLLVRANRPTLADAVDRLTTLARGGSAEAVGDLVVDLLEDGHGAERLCLDLLAPVARRLGQGWVDDECDFVDVTIGVWRLADALRLLSPMLRRGGRGRVGAADSGRVALLLPLPGEQHTFGSAMVAEFFRRAGWRALGTAVGTGDELAEAVAGCHVDLVGFSVAGDDFLEPARREIARVRAASRNKRLVVLLGGPCFVGRPTLAAALGADGSADDAPGAVACAERLLALAPAT